MKIKSLVRYPVDIRRAHALLATPRIPQESFSQRPIVLDLTTSQMLFDCGRHFASLAHYSNAIGSPFFVRCSSMLLACIARKIHGKEMLAEPYARWLSRRQPLPPDALVLRDHDNLAPQSVAAGNAVKMMIGKDRVAEAPVMPYPMHPATLRSADRGLIEKLRHSPRQFGLFFAGTQKAKYGDSRMQRNFSVLSRLEILESLRRHFSDQVVASAEEPTNSHSIVLCDSRVHPISPKQWLPTLARANFFVCCPGSCQPTCHNLIEAMSVGTIPLIEYGDRVTPNLQDGINAITFSGQQGLVDAVKRISTLTSHQLDVLRSNVAEFYDQHLRGEEFLAGLRDGQIACPSSRVCMPFHDRNFFQSTDLDSRAQAA